MKKTITTTVTLPADTPAPYDAKRMIAIKTARATGAFTEIRPCMWDVKFHDDGTATVSQTYFAAEAPHAASS